MINEEIQIKYSCPDPNAKTNYIINGFSIKDTILEGILKAHGKTTPEMAEIIEDLLLTKLHLKQGAYR